MGAQEIRHFEGPTIQLANASAVPAKKRELRGGQPSPWPPFNPRNESGNESGGRQAQRKVAIVLPSSITAS